MQRVPHATGSGEKWPCSLHRIATQARRVHEQNLARAIDTDRDGLSAP